jgi:uncharacterized membrane protein
MLVGVAGVAVVLGAAALPPFAPEAWRPALLQAFAGVCHQLPGRSPHIEGVPLAVCDRCAGIYAGIIFGGLLRIWSQRHPPRWMLLGATGLLALDWAGPLLGLWPNAPWSRALTGAVFGLAAGALLVQAFHRVLRARRAARLLQQSGPS